MPEQVGTASIGCSYLADACMPVMPSVPILPEIVSNAHLSMDTMSTMFTEDGEVRTLTDTVTKHVFVPNEAKMLYGCLNCDWKQSGRCEFLSKALKDGKVRISEPMSDSVKHCLGYQDYTYSELSRLLGDQRFVTQSKGWLICRRRKNWLAVMSGHYSKEVSFDTWQRDFNKRMGQLMLAKQWQQLVDTESGLTDVREELEQLKGQPLKHKGEDADLRDKEKGLRRRYDDLYAKWRGLWSDLTEFADKQVDRDTPKRMEIETSKKLTLMDIDAIIREDRHKAEAIDAEVKDATPHQDTDVQTDKD